MVVVRSNKEFTACIVGRGVLRAMWDELADTAINLLSANHAYLKTLYCSGIAVES